MGNIRRGGSYPLCVGAERVLQAQTIAQMALSLKTSMVAHGCTAAGNDQVRFEVALRTLAPGLTILAPVRDRAFQRPEQLKYLEEHRLPIPAFGAAYSVNRGLWGVTIGGKETLTSAGSIPEERLGSVQGGVLQAARAGTTYRRLHGRRAVEPGRQARLSRGDHRTSREPGGALRNRPRHSSRRHHHRHQGPRRLRGAGGGHSFDRASRARETGADRQDRRGSRNPWRSPTATWCTRASIWIRSAATSRRCSCPRRRA